MPTADRHYLLSGFVDFCLMIPVQFRIDSGHEVRPHLCLSGQVMKKLICGFGATRQGLGQSWDEDGGSLPDQAFGMAIRLYSTACMIGRGFFLGRPGQITAHMADIRTKRLG